MALTNFVRRAASRFVPLAARALGAQRCFHRHHCQCHCSAVFAAAGGSVSSFPPALHHYSTKSDESLLRVIESEIQCAEQTDEPNEAGAIPSGFPFKLEDNPGQQTVTLTRDYQGENIVVEVHMTNLVTGEGDEDNDNDNDNEDDTESGTQSAIPLVVRVSKSNGPCLEFGVTAYPDEIAIDSLSIKESDNSEDQIPYEGPDFGDLDENLQKAFHKYLEMRGIKPSTTNFLHEYMINKDSKEYFRWLNNLKKFVEA